MATKRRDPARDPAGDPRRRTDTRQTLTLKGDISREFKALLNRAAAETQMTQAAFVVEAVTREAQRVLKGEDEPAAGPPPAVVVDRLDAQDERIAALDADMRERLDRIERVVTDRGLRQWLRQVFSRRE